MIVWLVDRLDAAESRQYMQKHGLSFVVRRAPTTGELTLSACTGKAFVHVRVRELDDERVAVTDEHGHDVVAPTLPDLLLALGYIDAADKDRALAFVKSKRKHSKALRKSSGSGIKPKSEKVVRNARRVQVGLKRVDKLADAANDVFNGVSQLAMVVSVASPLLSAVVGLVAKVVAMRVQVSINKRKAAVLVDLVASFSVPLAEVEKLLAEKTLDVAFATHLHARLDSLRVAVEAAEAVLREWSELSAKTRIKRIKQTLAAHAIDRAFDDRSAELERCHALLCRDLTLKAAAVALGAGSRDAVARSTKAVAAAVAQAGDARKSDLESLERDLSAAMRALGTSLQDELKLLGWSLDDLHTSVAQMAALQHEMLAMQRQVLENQRELVQLVGQLRSDVVAKPAAAAAAAAAPVAIRHAAAAAFWLDVIAPKQPTGDTVPWVQFASAIFCELLKPANVPVSDWHAIKARVQELFDADLDGFVTIMEYDSVTSTRRQSVTEICLALLREHKRSEYADVLIEDALLADDETAARYPALTDDQSAMVQALFGATSTEDESLLFALSSVPRAWFAVDEHGAAGANACALERHWVAGGLRMPSPRLCVQLLRWLGFGRHDSAKQREKKRHRRHAGRAAGQPQLRGQQLRLVRSRRPAVRIRLGRAHSAGWRVSGARGGSAACGGAECGETGRCGGGGAGVEAQVGGAAGRRRVWRAAGRGPVGRGVQGDAQGQRRGRQEAQALVRESLGLPGSQGSRRPGR